MKTKLYAPVEWENHQGITFFLKVSGYDFSLAEVSHSDDGWHTYGVSPPLPTVSTSVAAKLAVEKALGVVRR